MMELTLEEQILSWKIKAVGSFLVGFGLGAIIVTLLVKW